MVIKEQEDLPKLMLDPFAGGGTTPLVATQNGIRCISFEVNPFLAQVCRAKLRKDYCTEELFLLLEQLITSLATPIQHNFSIGLKTITKGEGLKKWLLHKPAYEALLSIRSVLDDIIPPKYIDLMHIALASTAISCCNVFRDGKALKYRENWQNKKFYRSKVITRYLNKVKNEIIPDVKVIENQNNINIISGHNDIQLGDCRELIKNLKNKYVDLIITSPPYLNSRDYTDSLMVELWMLGHITNYEELRLLRQCTLRSHVQVRWGQYTLPESAFLKPKFKEILSKKNDFWNISIPSMIAGYFCDMEFMLKEFYKKLKKGGKAYINVANSSYFGITIETDLIIAELAQNIGFKVCDIRIARYIKSSSQQNTSVGRLRESVILLKKE